MQVRHTTRALYRWGNGGPKKGPKGRGPLPGEGRSRRRMTRPGYEVLPDPASWLRCRYGKRRAGGARVVYLRYGTGGSFRRCDDGSNSCDADYTFMPVAISFSRTWFFSPVNLSTSPGLFLCTSHRRFRRSDGGLLIFPNQSLQRAFLQHSRGSGLRDPSMRNGLP